MFVFDWLFWVPLTFAIISAVESIALTLGKYHIRLGFRFWRENLSDGNKLFFLALNNDIILPKLNFFQLPDYIVKHKNLIKMYANPNKQLLFVPFVAFINLDKSSPKIIYHCPILGVVWSILFCLPLAIPLAIVLTSLNFYLNNLIFVTLAITLPFAIFYLYLNFKVNRKSIHQFIERQIEQSSI